MQLSQTRSWLCVDELLLQPTLTAAVVGPLLRLFACRAHRVAKMADALQSKLGDSEPSVAPSPHPTLTGKLRAIPTLVGIMHKKGGVTNGKVGAFSKSMATVVRRKWDERLIVLSGRNIMYYREAPQAPKAPPFLSSPSMSILRSRRYRCAGVTHSRTTEVTTTCSRLLVAPRTSQPRDQTQMRTRTAKERRVQNDEALQIWGSVVAGRDSHLRLPGPTTPRIAMRGASPGASDRPQDAGHAAEDGGVWSNATPFLQTSGFVWRRKRQRGWATGYHAIACKRRRRAPEVDQGDQFGRRTPRPGSVEKGGRLRRRARANDCHGHGCVYTHGRRAIARASAWGKTPPNDDVKELWANAVRRDEMVDQQCPELASTLPRIL